MFHKIHLKETRPLIVKCMPKLDWERQNFLRSKGGYLPFENNGDKYSKSFFPNTSKLRNKLGPEIWNINLDDFKIYTKEQ